MRTRIGRIKNGSQRKDLRPTTGKVREALFNILRGNIEGARFLDLYAGTGAIGLEALNQGAAEVVFVEAGRSHAKKISELTKKQDITEKTRVINEKTLSFIARAELKPLTFDIIFLDPPYHTDEIIYALSKIGESDLLAENGVVIAEHFKKRQLPEKIGGLRKVKEYNYGDSELSFYEAS